MQVHYCYIKVSQANLFIYEVLYVRLMFCFQIYTKNQFYLTAPDLKGRILLFVHKPRHSHLLVFVCWWRWNATPRPPQADAMLIHIKVRSNLSSFTQCRSQFGIASSTRVIFKWQQTHLIDKRTTHWTDILSKKYIFERLFIIVLG